MSNQQYETADQIHALYQQSSKESLGEGASVIDCHGQLKTFLMDESDGTLTKKDSAKSKVVNEFLSFSRKKRSKETARGCFNVSDGRKVDVFMMSLNIDEDYLKCKYLFRCHVLYRIQNTDGSLTYYDSGAHRKFYNMGTPQTPETMPDNITKKQSSITLVEVHQKVSGSQNLCVVAPPELQKYFLFQFFSKRGTANIYSDLGAIAFRSFILKSGRSPKSLYQTLQQKKITSMTFEIMGVDRHVSMDNDTDSLILHGVSRTDASKMPMMEMESFAEEVGLPVVKPIFRSSSATSFQDGMKAYQDYDIEGNTNEGGVMTITYSDHQQKLKCKSWWYLFLRNCREAIPRGSGNAAIVPTLDGFKSRLKIFGAPEKDLLELSQKYVLWWLWVRSNQCDKTQLDLLEKGDHPLVLDHFLADPKYHDLKNYNSLYNTLMVDQRNKATIVILPINVGLMSSGKSTTSRSIGITLSQDNCGGSRSNLVKEIVKYFMDRSVELSQKMIILDRTNLTPLLRNQLLWDLAREMGKASLKSLLLVPVFICHTFPGYFPGELPEMLIKRAIATRKEKNSHETLTLEGNGTLAFLEILRNASYVCEFPSDSMESLHLNAADPVKDKTTKFYDWIQKRFPAQYDSFRKASKVYEKFGDYQQNRKTSLSYGGVATPFHNHLSTPALKDDFHSFLEANQGRTREYNSHVTKVYGADQVKKLEWDEGREKDLVWIGTFQQDQQVCGSIVLDLKSFPSSARELKSLPGDTLVYHVTGWTVDKVTPFQSNIVLNGATKTKGDKPRLDSLLSLFPEGELTWKGMVDDCLKLDSEQLITLKLFEKPRVIAGYEGTFRK